MSNLRTRRVVAIGTSAGGLDALRTLLAGLPADFPAPICVVMHTAPESPGVLHEILGRATHLVATCPSTTERLEAGHVYVARPDAHLVIEPGRVRVTRGPRENRFRPAIDPLFRSAAQVYGPGAIGIILTGSLDDGTAGLKTIKQLGGVAIVQDPADAVYPSMPRSALQHVDVDHCLAVVDMAPVLVQLTAAPLEDSAGPAVPDPVSVEVNIAKEHNPVDAGLERIGEPSSFACPECHGVLLQLKDEGLVRFRCHTGHAYSADSLLAAVGEGVDEALWNAVRSFEEAGLLMQRLAHHLRTTHPGDAGDRMAGRAEQMRRQSDVLRRLARETNPVAPES